MGVPKYSPPQILSFSKTNAIEAVCIARSAFSVANALQNLLHSQPTVKMGKPFLNIGSH